MSFIRRQLDHRLRQLGHQYLKGLLRLVEISQSRARFVLAVTLVVSLAAVYYSAFHFGMDTDTSGILSRDLPFQRLEHAYHQSFPQTKNTIVVVIDGDTSAAAAGAVERLEAWVRADPTDFTGVYAPGGGEFFQRNGLLFLSVPELQDFADRIAEAQPLIGRLSRNPNLEGLLDLLDTAISQGRTGQQWAGSLSALFEQMAQAVRALEEKRFYEVRWGALMGGGEKSAFGRQRFLIINPRLDYRSLEPAQIPLRALRAAVDGLHLDAAHGVRVGVTGEAALDSEQLKTVSTGAGLALALTLGLEVLLLVIALRSARLVLSVLTSLLTGMILTTALALFFLGPFNLLSVAFAILFAGMGVDFGIQFCLRYKEEVSQGAVHPAALRRVATGLGGALSLAAAAAAVSFFSFVPTRYAGMVDLGLISGTSMFIALFTTLTVLPALLTVWPFRTGGGKRQVLRRQSGLPIRPNTMHRYARWIVGASVLLFLAAVPLIARVSFDFDPLNMINPRSESVRVFHRLLRHSDTSLYRIEIVAPNLTAARQMASRLGRLPEVSQVVTLASFVPSRQRDKLAILQNLRLMVPPFSLLLSANAPDPISDLPAALVRFESRLHDLAADHSESDVRRSAASLWTALKHFQVQRQGSDPSLAELQSRILGELPAQLKSLGLALNAGPVTLDGLPRALRDRYVAADGRARVEVFPRQNLDSNAAIERFVSSVQTVAPQAVGTPVMLVQGGKAVADAFREASLIALLSIVCLLLVVLRRWVDTVLVLAPLLLAAVLTVAAMSVLGLTFNLGNIIVLPLLIGMGVAFAIYLVTRWRQGVSIAHLLQTSTPAAVLFSGLTTLSSFGSMAISSDPGMASLGKTLALALVMALLCTLGVLPAMLTLLTPSSEKEKHASRRGSE